MSESKRRGKSPKKCDVAEFWSKAMPVDENHCFGCGQEADANDPHSITRAHINSHRGGGNTYVGNLNLLCKKCHKTSEYFEGERYWDWFFCQRNSKGLFFQEQDLLDLHATMRHGTGGWETV